MTTSTAHIKEKDSRDVSPMNVVPTSDTSKELAQIAPNKEASDPTITTSPPDNLKKSLRRLKRRGDAENFSTLPAKLQVEADDPYKGHFGTLPVNLQTKVDTQYGKDLAKIVNTINTTKSDLMHTVEPLKLTVHKFHNDPKLKDADKERDLTNFQDGITRLQILYEKHADEIYKIDPNKQTKKEEALKKFEKVFERIDKLKNEDLEFLQSTIDLIKEFATRILDQSANQILLKSQLLLAISHILFLIQKTYCEAQERLARNTLNK